MGNYKLIDPLHPLQFEINRSVFSLQNPQKEDLAAVLPELQNEGLDLRRLVSTKDHSYAPLGAERVKYVWDEAVERFRNEFPDDVETLKNIKRQRDGIFRFRSIPEREVFRDPFNLKPVEEKRNIEQLRDDQLKNTLIIKKADAVISFGRLLEVEGSTEIVSLWTRKDWRKKGLAGRIIGQLFSQSTITPIFSFQTLNLVPYYLREYNKHRSAKVCQFEDLPLPLQRDLFFMNIFWGPNIIIKIE